MEDADLDEAARSIVALLTSLNGQWCRALGRLIVHQRIAEKLLLRAMQMLRELKLGDSLSLESQMGPLVHSLHLERYDNARVQFQHELRSFTDHGTHITAEVATPDGTKQWQAKYIVGADGSRSQVRACLGLGFTGRTYEDRFLLVACDLDLQPYFPQMGPVAYLFDPEEWVIVMHLPNLTRIVFQLRAHENAAEEITEPKARARVARFLGTEADYNISSVTNYNVHQRVTDRFRVGRALLAGDAAHINNPTGGMGMNSGIHDAWHLAKALTAVLRGEAEALLDDYADARRKVAVESVQSTADQSYVNLTAQDAQVHDERDRELREIAADPVKARAFLLRQAMLAERI